MKEKEYLYYNGYGGFSKDGKEYVIDTSEKTTPLPWSHVIANEKFGTIVTANGGGYVWYGNSQSNKITSWSNDSILDTPSEMLILHIGEKKIELLPYHTLENYTVTYGFGYAKYVYEDDIFLTETLIYVPLNVAKKVYDIRVSYRSNTKKDTASEEWQCENEEKALTTFLEYTMVPVLGVSREYTKKHLVIEQQQNRIVIQNHYRENYGEENVWVDVSTKIEAFSSEDAMVKIQVPLLKVSQIGVLGEVQLMLGCQEPWQKEEEVLWRDIAEDQQAIRTFWEEKRNRVRVTTPVESMNLMMNGWLLYQTLCCRMWARTSFYQAGGAFGFRDQLQDSLLLLWFAPELTRKQILLHAAHQFEEGDVLHWWHSENNAGTRTRYTDDLLWLPYVLSEYVLFTGDTSILEERVPYVKSEPLKENEVERYTQVETTAYEDTIFHHAKRAIQYGVTLSENGLPKMKGGDWNDGMNQIQGQSIWLGFFIYTVLEKFKKICEIMEDEENKDKYEEWQAILKKSLNEYGWDGKWYRRAYFETGEPVGSSQNEECKIDGISQSWAVISGAGEIGKCEQAMESLDTYLVDRENMLIKLLTPPFDKTEKNPGYIKEYIPGVRENGGQYTHGACCCGHFSAQTGTTIFVRFS